MFGKTRRKGKRRRLMRKWERNTKTHIKLRYLGLLNDLNCFVTWRIAETVLIIWFF